NSQRGTSAAEAAFTSRATARLKPCPDKNPKKKQIPRRMAPRNDNGRVFQPAHRLKPVPRKADDSGRVCGMLVIAMVTHGSRLREGLSFCLLAGRLPYDLRLAIREQRQNGAKYKHKSAQPDPAHQRIQVHVNYGIVAFRAASGVDHV